ncbi:MAG: flagellar biosynthesis protein FlhB [Buchnera aphidicola (Brevicoryne brassicae)]|uniref:Flagellar biosynthetic protein FlhB n=1 Tax=Buchnera aphidicola (Brevicoryne brassicae) TaxID=911343 RepID=A0AAJ5PUV7_9GAMM|nr:flagellar biosynthesis protein FlhB [Buchnera aphidicola]QCI19811.1 flagellar type III secretion system protein FlhB [Buchnera aphidicola (Brevicoryne brassicae)]WAI19186.1 MAG: flagellar biosynthesis protein FlhB [Buchnera aphidicola (Brevicoryne brassicae)]
MNHNTNEEKTENPTEHRIKKFRKKGKTRYSRELNSLLILLVGFISLWWHKDFILSYFMKIMFNSFSFNRNIIINNDSVLLEIFIFFKAMLFIFFPFLMALLFIIIIPPILLSGIALNFKSLEFNFTKLNPFHGLKRIFSFEIIIEFFKIALKLFIVISISFWYLYYSFSEILALIHENFISSLFHGFNIIVNCCFFIILGLVPVVVFDVILQQIKYFKKLKMTYQEIKDEFREKEGNPSIKSRIRQEMKAIIRRRMISDIPKADVIITNPIHYSIALQYDEKKMNAPKVIAKGIGEMAIRIQKLALKHDISMISAPSLARSLYRYSEIGQYIPGPLYKAVAEVLAWVWKVRKWKKKGGIFPEKPKNIIVPSELTVIGEHKNND